MFPDNRNMNHSWGLDCLELFTERRPMCGMMSGCYSYRNLLCGYFLFAEPVNNDVSRDSSHTQHAALRAPGQTLDGKRVFIHYVSTGLLLLVTGFFKHLGCFQLVQHLQHYCVITAVSINMILFTENLPTNIRNLSRYYTT